MTHTSDLTRMEAGAQTRILVVDDDPQVVRVIASMAERAGHEVEIATSAEEAVSRLDQTGFDVVLTDLDFGPDRPNGLEVLQHVQRNTPEVPVVIITGQA